MAGFTYLILVVTLAVISALPVEDPVISTLGSDLRYQYMRASDGTPHLIDTWLKSSDYARAARFNPDQENVYHLFTRSNPSVSQVLLPGNANLLAASNFNPQRRTIVLIHGWVDSITANFNLVLIPAFLQAEDVNVIGVDWSAGAFAVGQAMTINTILSGQSVARFINWLNTVSGASPADYHIAGFSLGGHQSGVVGRNILGGAPYITALDPANGWYGNEHIFSTNAGLYTEAIHTGAGGAGIGIPVADVDFYPNGGNNMPGCTTPPCNHDRAYFYFAESLTSGGFTGIECATYEDARAGTCNGNRTLHMGGLGPKTGITGMFHLTTAASPPFSLG